MFCFPNLFSCFCYSVGFYSVGPEVLDEEGTQEDLEYKLKGLIDLTLDKRYEVVNTCHSG